LTPAEGGKRWNPIKRKRSASSSFGYEKAEVMRGGVSLLNLNQNLEAEKVSGLYFIGEVLDITGEVGGFNLHIAFATANCVARAINNP